ncbi:hypothetical protein ACVWZZ_004162 [Bradyrhizobium sp. LM6.10]
MQRFAQPNAGGEIAGCPFDVRSHGRRSRENPDPMSVPNEAIDDIPAKMAGYAGDECQGHASKFVRVALMGDTIAACGFRDCF